MPHRQSLAAIWPLSCLRLDAMAVTEKQTQSCRLRVHPDNADILSMQATQDKVQALVRLSEAERSHQRSSNQVETLKKQNQDLMLRLREATQEKVNALMRVAADGNSSQAATAAGKGMPSPQKGPTWKVG